MPTQIIARNGSLIRNANHHSYKNTPIKVQFGMMRQKKYLAEKCLFLLREAFRYILTHELGHVFHAVVGLQPPYNKLTWEPDQMLQYPYNRIYYGLAGPTEPSFPFKMNITWYTNSPNFHLGQAETIYNWLRHTNHPTLYGSLNELEDFGETFALHIHTEYLGKPYQLLLTKGGKELLRLESRLKSPAQQKKVMMIEKALQRYRD